MLFLDHTFTNDDNHCFLKKLEKCGFTLSTEEVEHPGKAFCRFIKLNGNTPRGLQYLEFIHIGRSGAKCTKPGISFGYRKGLKDYYNKLKKKLMSILSIKIMHEKKTVNVFYQAGIL